MADRDTRQDIYELHLIHSTGADISHVVEQLVEARGLAWQPRGGRFKAHIQRKIFIDLTLAGSRSRGQKTSSNERELASGCLETPFPEVDLPGFKY